MKAKTYDKMVDVITKNGKFIGSGCDRMAYLYKDKVYKYPKNVSPQATFEKKIWEKMPDNFKTYFPNPNFYGKIVEMEPVTTAYHLGMPNSAAGNFEGEWSASYSYINEYPSLEKLPDEMEVYDDSLFKYDIYIYHTTLGRVVRKFGPKNFDYETFQNLLVWLTDEGSLIEDILNNSGNFGLDKNNNLKIVDWGWSEESIIK